MTDNKQTSDKGEGKTDECDIHWHDFVPLMGMDNAYSDYVCRVCNKKESEIKHRPEFEGPYVFILKAKDFHLEYEVRDKEEIELVKALASKTAELEEAKGREQKLLGLLEKEVKERTSHSGYNPNTKLTEQVWQQYTESNQLL